MGSSFLDRAGSAGNYLFLLLIIIIIGHDAVFAALDGRPPPLHVQAGGVQGGRAGGADRDRGAARLACGGWADQDRRALYNMKIVQVK